MKTSSSVSATAPPFEHVCKIASTVVNPRFTIAIPTFNRMDVLHIAVESVLKQHYDQPFELIIVDNASEAALSDRVLALIAQSNGKAAYYRNVENVGMFNNWSQCVRLAKGEWVTLLSDDDLLDHDALKYVSQYDLSHCNLIFGRFDRIDVQTHALMGEGPVTNFQARIERTLFGQRPRTIVAKDFLYTNQAPAGLVGMFFRRKLLLETGGFAPENYPCADYCTAYKYTNEHGPALKIPHRLGFYCMGINEYLRKEVMIGMVKMNLQLRAKIVTEQYADRLFYRAVRQLVAAIDAGATRHFHDLDGLDVGVPGFYRPWIAPRGAQALMLAINTTRMLRARLSSR